MTGAPRANPLPLVFLIVLIDLMGIGILIPIIPHLLANPASPFYMLPEGWSVERGYLLLGVLVAVFPLMQFVATPILGEISDRFGRRPILLISLCGTGIGHLLFGYGILVRSLPLLFFARAMDGVTGGNISVAQAAISDSTRPEDRAKSFGLVGVAFGLGFIMGPYIGGKLSDPAVVGWFNAATPFWFAALLSAGNVAFVALRFPETHLAWTTDRGINWRKSAQNINRAWRLAPLRPLYATSFLFQSGFAFFTTFFGVFLINHFGFTQGNIGDFFSYIGLWIVFAQGVVVRRASRLYSEPTVLRLSIVGAGASVLAYLAPHAWWGLLFIAPVFSIFVGLTQANLVGLVSRSAGPRIQGEVLGINASVHALAQGIPPLLAGVVASTLSADAPLVIASALLLLAGLVFIRFFRPVPEPVS